MIGGVVSFSPTIDKQNEDVDFINGSTIRDSIEVRKTGELTLNLKKQNDVFARLYQSAPVGVNTTTAAVEVMNNDYPANNAEFGYRIIIFDGVKYMVFYHCTMTGYNSPPGNDKNMAITEKYQIHIPGLGPRCCCWFCRNCQGGTMMFRLANKTKMFITTESLTGAIDLDPAVAYAIDSGLGATDGIATGTAIRKLGDVVDDTNTRSMIPGLLGIDTPDTGSIRGPGNIQWA